MNLRLGLGGMGCRHESLLLLTFDFQKQTNPSDHRQGVRRGPRHQHDPRRGKVRGARPPFVLSSLEPAQPATPQPASHSLTTIRPNRPLPPTQPPTQPPPQPPTQPPPHPPGGCRTACTSRRATTLTASSRGRRGSWVSSHAVMPSCVMPKCHPLQPIAARPLLACFGWGEGEGLCIKPPCQPTPPI